ncbi:MAG: (d)CMP kinase [Nitrospinae bacterium]|nr:(d)CMP kinase [Nitrospinota bacterium]
MGHQSSEMPEGAAQGQGACGKHDLLVTIDGPAGAGKSTLALRLARYGGWRYIDSGAMYRAAALLAREQGISWTDEAALTCLCTHLVFAFCMTEGQPVIHVNGRDVTHMLRAQSIGEGASRLGTLQGVREVLVRKQRELGPDGGIVMEGRDIGTVVFPDADVKFYLDAQPEARGQRRWHELQRRGEPIPLAEVIAELRQRDHDDRTRAVSPLRIPAGASYIDTSNLSIDEVFALMVDKIKPFSISFHTPDPCQGTRCLKPT